MAFPSSGGSVPYTLEAAWQGARTTAAMVKSQAQQLAGAAQSAAVSGQTLISFAAFLADSYARLNQYASLSGIAAYAQNQIGDATFDVSSAFTAMTSAISATVGWIKGNFPKDANGNLLYVQFTSDGHTQYTSFTVAQLANFVTQLNSLIATID